MLQYKGSLVKYKGSLLQSKEVCYNTKKFTTIQREFSTIQRKFTIVQRKFTTIVYLYLALSTVSYWTHSHTTALCQANQPAANYRPLQLLLQGHRSSPRGGTQALRLQEVLQGVLCRVPPPAHEDNQQGVGKKEKREPTDIFNKFHSIEF